MEITRSYTGFILSKGDHYIQVEFDVSTDGQPIGVIFEDGIPDPIFISNPSNSNLWKVAYRLASQDLRLCAY